MSKSISTQTLLDFIDQLPKKEQDIFLVDFCRAIQGRKDEIIKITGFDPFPDNYDTRHVPSGIDPLRYFVAEQVLKTLLGNSFHLFPSSESFVANQDLDQNSTEAALQRVEELKHKYTPEKIAEMRRLRAEVEQLLTAFIEKRTDDERDEVLRSYGIVKFPWRWRYKGEGKTPVEFIKNESHGYKQWIDAGVIFKAEVRKIDKSLVQAIRETIRGFPEIDPLKTEDQYTELVAAGIFGNKRQQQVALATVKRRELDSNLKRAISSI